MWLPCTIEVCFLSSSPFPFSFLWTLTIQRRLHELRTPHAGIGRYLGWSVVRSSSRAIGSSRSFYSLVLRPGGLQLVWAGGKMLDFRSLELRTL